MRPSPHALLKLTRDFFKLQHSRHDMRFLFLGGVIGIVAGGGAILFREAIEWVTALFFGRVESAWQVFDRIQNVPWWLALIPVPVGAFVAWFTRRFAPEAQGHGVPEIMGAMATNRGIIKLRVASVKLLASALSIGSGFSVGREGPTALIGATIGSWFGTSLNFPVQKMKLVVGCGTAAGIAATFNAPLAGTAFALELVVGQFNVRLLAPIILSAMLATVVTHNYYGEFHSLFASLRYETVHPFMVLLYGLQGVLMGFVGVAFAKLLYGSEGAVHKLNIPIAVKGGIGGAGIAVCWLFLPQVTGPATWDTINATITQGIDQKMAYLFLVIGAAKLVMTCWSLAWGGSGGVFAPSLLIGGTLGAGYGYVIHQLVPKYTGAPYGYSLVGMGAFVAGVTQAPLTAISIIFEMTNNMSIILPLIVSSAMAIGVYNHFVDGSIYTLKLKRRGLNIEWGRETGVLENVKVSKVYAQIENYFFIDTPLKDVFERFKDATRSTIVVVDHDFILQGMVSFWELREVMRDESNHDKPVADVMKKDVQFITPNQNLYDAFSLISSGDFDYLPVVDNAHSKRLLGRLSRQRVMQVYKNQLTLRGIIDSGESQGPPAPRSQV